MNKDLSIFVQVKLLAWKNRILRHFLETRFIDLGIIDKAILLEKRLCFKTTSIFIIKILLFL
jgi:hypothetical protein